VGEDPALQESPELSLDEPWRGAAAVAGPGEKRLELFRDDVVENGLVRPARSVGVRECASGTIGGVDGRRYWTPGTRAQSATRRCSGFPIRNP
jgi:hypothetical protein